MKTKRIGVQGLRRLIMAEVRKLHEAEVPPEWEELVSRCAGAAAEEFSKSNPYEDDDGMGEERGGEPAWSQQVEDAAQTLTEELLEVIAPVIIDVQTRLIEGEFWSGG